MKHRLTPIATFFLLFTVLSISSCSQGLSGPRASLQGRWSYLTNEYGNSAYSYDLEFADEGQLTLIGLFGASEDARYAIIAPGKVKITRGEQADVITFTIIENELRLMFEDGYNLYARADAPPIVSDATSESTEPAETQEVTPGVSPQSSPTAFLTSSPIPAGTSTLSPNIIYRAGDQLVSSIDEMVIIYISKGDFLMGSPYGEWDSDEQPQHKVYLDAYWIDKTEVTNAMYEKCVDERVCTPPASYSSITHVSYYGNSQFDDYPVIYVDHSQAEDYCEWAGRRLPTEAEWEKAARGENGSIFPWGNYFSCFRGNFDDETQFDNYTVDGGKNCDGYIEVAPVGSFPRGASIYGVLDMSGNVWEWVQDWYDPNYESGYLTNPKGPLTGTKKVMRGGSWDNIGNYIRSAKRLSNNPIDTFKNAGFRCAKTP